VATNERDRDLVTRFVRQITEWLAAGDDAEGQAATATAATAVAAAATVAAAAAATAVFASTPAVAALADAATAAAATAAAATAAATAANAAAAMAAAPPLELALEPTNSFLRALTYQHLELDLFGSKQPPGFIASTSREFPDGAARIVLKRASPHDVAAQREAKDAEKRRAACIHDGFTPALRMLASCGAPAVGHNSLYDCVFTIDKFLSALDGSYPNFKKAFSSSINGAFYDTKLIAQRFMEGFISVSASSLPPVHQQRTAGP
jgi:poly(A)-specific ribonuclease